MSNTVKIKNRKKKKELKINYKLWAVIFGVFVAAIVALAIWASFHWGVGMGTIGVEPVTPEDPSVSATDMASEYATDGVMTVTPEMLEQMGISMEEEDGVEGAEAVEEGAAEEAEGAAAAAQEDGAAASEENTDAEDGAAVEEGAAASEDNAPEEEK